MKVMISQPMAGRTEQEIAATRHQATKFLEEKGYEVVNSLFTEEFRGAANSQDSDVVNWPLHFLARSLDAMSKCDAVHFCKDWHVARGCRLEHDIATEYGLTISYDENLLTAGDIIAACKPDEIVKIVDMSDDRPCLYNGRANEIIDLQLLSREVSDVGQIWPDQCDCIININVKPQE